MGTRIEDWGSREDALKAPTSFNLAAYLYKNHNLPKQIINSEIVYHYTDAAGFLGIISSGRFWATSTDFLNDPSETTFALDAIDSFLTEHGKTHPEDADFCTKCRIRLHEQERSSRYVVSFCRDGDLLSQWRGYGEFGAGYALGFYADQLKSAPKGGMCHEITYGTQQLEPALRDLMELLKECSKSGSGYCDEYAFSNMANYIALAVKHPKYCEEREVRLIFQRDKDRTTRGDTDQQRGAALRYRARGADIVEYLDTPVAFAESYSKDPMPKLPLCKVVVGPGAMFSKNMVSIRAVLLCNGIEGVDIIESKVPFKSR